MSTKTAKPKENGLVKSTKDDGLQVVYRMMAGNSHSVALEKIDTQTLKNALSEALRLTAEHLLRLSLIWAELERRGEDLSALKTGIGVYLSKIAAKRLLPEVVVRYAGEPGIINRLSSYDPAIQQTVLDGGAMPWANRPKAIESNGHASSISSNSDRQPSASPRDYHEQRSEPESRMEGRRPESNPIDLAKVVSPRDLTDLILNMVRANDQSRHIAQQLIYELGKLVDVKKK
jgi:hypothetical protein